MFIYYGERLSTRRLGQVADLCPACREVRPHTLGVRRLRSHIYLISFGPGKPAGFELRCVACGTVREADPTRFRELGGREPLELLIERTLPGDDELVAALERERRLERGQVEEDDAEAIVLELLGVAEQELAARAAGSDLDAWSGLALVGALIGLPLFLVIGAEMAADEIPGAALVMALAPAGVVGALLTMLGDRRRFAQRLARRTVLPGLRLLGPSEAQLIGAMSELSGDEQVARYYPLEWLVEQLEQLPPVERGERCLPQPRPESDADARAGELLADLFEAERDFTETHSEVRFDGYGAAALALLVAVPCAVGALGFDGAAIGWSVALMLIVTVAAVGTEPWRGAGRRRAELLAVCAEARLEPERLEATLRRAARCEAPALLRAVGWRRLLPDQVTR